MVFWKACCNFMRLLLREEFLARSTRTPLVDVMRQKYPIRLVLPFGPVKEPMQTRSPGPTRLLIHVVVWGPGSTCGTSPLFLNMSNVLSCTGRIWPEKYRWWQSGFTKLDNTGEAEMVPREAVLEVP